MSDLPLRELNQADTDRFRQILSGPPEQAARWLRAAAEQGVTEAQVHYGQWLLQGNGVKADPQAACQWFRQAARQGHAMGMNMLGRCYENGWGVSPDMLMAAYWFRLAANAGLDWGMYNYATSLALGRGVDMDRGQALAWLRKATGLGHAKSWNLLGGFLEDGWACEADPEAAWNCYRKAAEGGDFRGQFNIGRLLAGRNEISEARIWLEAAYRNLAATAAFRKKMLRFLYDSGAPDLVVLAYRLAYT